MHRIWSETLDETLGDTLWREKSRQESRRKSRQESCQDPLRDSCRDFSRQRVSSIVLPRFSDRILCMTLGETLSETRFFTRVLRLPLRKLWMPHEFVRRRHLIFNYFDSCSLGVLMCSYVHAHVYSTSICDLLLFILSCTGAC